MYVGSMYKIMENYIYNYFVGPLIDNNRNGGRNHRDGRTGDRRIDNDSNSRNSTQNSQNNSERVEDNYSDDDYGYYDDYEKEVLSDYYTGDYDEDSITEESEEELPTNTRTARTPTSIDGKDNRKENENSRPLVGRKILSANPAQLHIESQHEMDHMMMMMLRNAIGKKYL